MELDIDDFDMGQIHFVRRARLLKQEFAFGTSLPVDVGIS